MGLVETGTRGLLGAVFGPTSTGETTYAQQLMHLLDEGMLVLADRGFDTNAFLTGVAGTKAQLLVRAKSTRRPPKLAVLPDGSWLTRIAGVNLRVIDAVITVIGTDGTVITGSYRLLTTLTDHRANPAARLVQLYHEKWEIEMCQPRCAHRYVGVVGSGVRGWRGVGPMQAGVVAVGTAAAFAELDQVVGVGFDDPPVGGCVLLPAGDPAAPQPGEQGGRGHVEMVGQGGEPPFVVAGVVGVARSGARLWGLWSVPVAA